MNIFDRLSERVGDFLDEVMLPEEIRALHERARQAIKRGDYERALQWLGEAEHRRPGVERTRHMRALCHFYKGDLDGAIELFEEALEMREEPSSHFYLGLCFEKKEQFSDAQGHFQRALELDENPPFGFDLHFGLGRTFLALGRPARASRELKRALRIWPEQNEAALTLAEALRQRERFEEAREILRNTVSSATEPQALMTLGLVEEATGHHREAATAFESILETNPTELDALLGGARAYLALRQPARANELLIRALGTVEDKEDTKQSAASSAQIFALIGETNERVQNLEKALQSYEAALERDAGVEVARIGAARVGLQLEKFEDAAAHFEHLLRSSSTEHQAEALLGLGRCRLALGDFAGARHLLEEADQLHRQRPATLLHALGCVALESGDPAEALVSFREALHQNPDEEAEADIKADMNRAFDALKPHFELPEHFESTAALVATLSKLRDSLAKEPRLEAFLSPVYELLATLDSPLSVAILGEFNAGKSTLVNAILGEEVVPMGVLPTTAHPCIMGYGPRKGARIVYEDGRLQDVDFATARKLMKAEAEEIRRLDYTYPHPELRSLQYWDTPGFNALDERHEMLAAEALQKTEAIVWMLDANQALKETEFALLSEIEDSERRVLLVLNKIDRFGDEEARKESVDEIVAYLQDNAGDEVLDVLAISALEALRSRTDENQPTSDDFQELMRLLDEHFVQRSWQIKISEVSRSLHQLLGEIEALRTDEISHFAQLITEARDLQGFLDESRDSASERAREHALALSDRLDFVTFGIEREISDALRRRGRLLRRYVLEDEDRAFVLDLFRERLEHVLESFRRDLLRETTELETKLAERLSPLLANLSVTDARPIRRRLEGFFDETRALKTVLDERVFGQWRARTEGQLDTGGDAALTTISELGVDATRQDRRRHLSALIPDVSDDFAKALSAWQEEFFLAATRFCDRLQRDLTSLELEVRYRLDFSASEPLQD